MGSWGSSSVKPGTCSTGTSTKWEKLRELLDQPPLREGNARHKLVLFTESRDTLVHLREKLKRAGGKAPTIEGAERCDWVLIDGGDVIVHLFRPEVRSFYNLEKMWGMDLPEPERSSAGL